MGLLWSVVQPPLGVGDESRHLVRAAATIRLDFGINQSSGFLGWQYRDYLIPEAFRVDETFIPCYHLQEEILPTCVQEFVSSENLVSVRSPYIDLPPGGYFLTGLPLVLWPSQEGFYLARFLSVLWSSLALAYSMNLLARIGKTWVIISLLLTITPMAFSLIGSLNPHGMEIAFGAAYLVLLATAISQEEPNSSLFPRRSKTFWLMATLIAGFLPLFRQATFVWLIPGVLAVWFAVTRKKSVVFKTQEARIETKLLILVCYPITVSVAWYLLSRGFGHTGIAGGYVPAPGGFWENTKALFELSDTYLLQMVGWFGWGEIYTPSSVFLLFVCLVSGLQFIALQGSGSRPVLSSSGVLTALVLIPVISEAQTSFDSFGYQGRYGLVLFQAFGISGFWRFKEQLLGNPRVTRAIVLTGAFTVQFVAFWLVGKRYTVGENGPWMWLGREFWPTGLLLWPLRIVTVLSIAIGAILGIKILLTNQIGKITATND